MQFKQQIKEKARSIISFTDSYAQNIQGKENEQPESEPTSSLIYIVSSLQYLRDQIQNNNTRKQLIQIPKLLQSLVALSLYKDDEQDQTELVNFGYGRVTSISISTAGGIGEEEDLEIYYEQYRIYWFLRDLYEGRNYRKPSFQPLPLLARMSLEQIEEEGADEEIDAQITNNGYNGIKIYANKAKAVKLNRFIYWD
ncbi:MAG: hypothetical protein EZS28_025604 [Streblomastix strix]|uniref:Uncharacterized protein n=1 Tax=Streblomastix strix TaxID=222440 RepID=A0A5J4V8T8_9EUKA|nr:MAG: hypothetical protein EZS28_025604 [Streblomastix strix]